MVLKINKSTGNGPARIMADSGKRDRSASVGRENPRKRHETTPSHAAASTSKTGQPKHKCGKCHEVGHLRRKCPRIIVRKNEAGKCAKCGKLHDTVNCTVIETWRNWEIGQPMNVKLLRAVVVPDDNCKAITVDLKKSFYDKPPSAANYVGQITRFRRPHLLVEV